MMPYVPVIEQELVDYWMLLTITILAFSGRYIHISVNLLVQVQISEDILKTGDNGKMFQRIK